MSFIVQFCVQAENIELKADMKYMIDQQANSVEAKFSDERFQNTGIETSNSHQYHLIPELAGTKI